MLVAVAALEVVEARAGSIAGAAVEVAVVQVVVVAVAVPEAGLVARRSESWCSTPTPHCATAPSATRTEETEAAAAAAAMAEPGVQGATRGSGKTTPNLAASEGQAAGAVEVDMGGAEAVEWPMASTSPVPRTRPVRGSPSSRRALVALVAWVGRAPATRGPMVPVVTGSARLHRALEAFVSGSDSPLP